MLRAQSAESAVAVVVAKAPYYFGSARIGMRAHALADCKLDLAKLSAKPGDYQGLQLLFPLIP